jgi:RNA 3'-terminal phosphate cyclase (ATP)
LRLPRHIGDRELAIVGPELGLQDAEMSFRDCPSPGPGNAVLVTLGFDNVVEVFSAFGKKGVPAEAVAREVVDAVRCYLASEAPVGPHLADQLLLPLALAGGGSFRTGELTPHTRTNIEVLGSFLDVRVSVARHDAVEDIELVAG